VKNNGVLPQYYVTNNHEAIIPENIFDRAQEEIARRNSKRKSAMKIAKTENGKYSGKYALSELLYCGNCGTPYRRVTWARNGKKRIVWRCISRLEYGTKYCKDSPTIEENQLHEVIMKAIQSFTKVEEEVKETVRASLKHVLNDGRNEIDLYETKNQVSVLQDKLIELVQAGIETDADIEHCGLQFKETLDEIKIQEERIHVIKLKDSIEQNTSSKVKEIFDLLDNDKIIMDGYDETLVRRLIEGIKVLSADRLLITFKCGIELNLTL
jgi:site-specific DNA recombinase